MDYRRLGQSPLTVSAVGLGGNNFGDRLDLAATRQVVHAALDRGITLIDTADTYNAGASEAALGEILGARRKDVVLATKFGLSLEQRGKREGASRRYIMGAVEASLKRLRTDWIDLYQVHLPDPATPIEETLRALDDLVRAGKVRAIGCSNFSARQVDEAQDAAARSGLAAFATCQDQYSLLARGIERELIPAMQRRGLSLLPYFPLASGLLTGKYRRGAIPAGARLAYSRRHQDRFISERNWAILEALDAFCGRQGRTMLELAFAWLLAKSAVASVIAGASTQEQVAQNIVAAERPLSAGEVAELDHITGDPA
jgi:aryl-alcohol dehydrogenase-like predicted oxidoreductase